LDHILREVFSMSRQKIANDEYLMLRPDAPFVASLMPDHRGKVTGYSANTGKSTRFCKHPYGTGFNYFDSRCVKELLGVVMTKSAMLEVMTGYFLDYPNFGVRGGKASSCRVAANRCLYALYREGLIVPAPRPIL
jgi:hypothetical protein